MPVFLKQAFGISSLRKESTFSNHFFGFNNCTVRPTLGAVSCAIDNSIGTMKVF